MPAKRPHEGVQEEPARSRKKQKTIDARVIRFQSGPSSGTGVVNSMGGLPGAIDIEKFTEARSFEIKAMQSSMQTARSSSTQRAWQALPRSLRRRAASHDVRRVPVRLRGKARAEMDPAKRKALGRKLPKRGNSKQINRTLSFLKRQRDKTWLETHLWHAKRMHMKNVWGYRLSETPTEKSYRPSHRSSIHSSILHDASYISTISVSGKQILLERMLIRCSDCQGAGPGAVRYTLGSRVHETHLYQPGSYPFGLIAPAVIMWKPLSVAAPHEGVPDGKGISDKDSQPKSKRRRRGKGKEKEDATEPVTKPGPGTLRTLWIRVHPSAWQEVWDAVQMSASIVLDECRQEYGAHGNKDDNNEGRDSINEILSAEESIDLMDLRSQINCFELMGPRSSQIIRGAMTLVNGDDRPLFHEFWSQLKELQSPGSVPRGMIISFKVHDPRLNFPPKNAKPGAIPTGAGKPSATLPTPFTVFPNAVLARGELWDEVERSGGARRPSFQKKDLDERRRQNLIPGTVLQPLRQDDRVPVMLIQRTAASSHSYSSSSKNRANTHIENMHGWTILLPSHWSMPFFTSLIYTGTRVGGLRERRTQLFEANSPDFPFDYPLTVAYAKEAELSEKVERERWEKKPPAKRVEWESVGTRSPWRADWEVVLDMSPPQVQRTEEGLLDVQREPAGDISRPTGDDSLDTKKAMWLLRGSDTPDIIEAATNAQHPAVTLLDRINALRAKRALKPLQGCVTQLLKGTLVSVKLEICGRGNPDDLAAIYEVGHDEGCELRQMLARKKGGDIEGDADDELSKLVAGDSTIIGYVTTGLLKSKIGKERCVGLLQWRFWEHRNQVDRRDRGTKAVLLYGSIQN
ncbi:NUC188 domain-containing protein [Gautieria morchelliformis]|nr:NUC188 domain-containing protein [Gautieria morchelliformis]